MSAQQKLQLLLESIDSFATMQQDPIERQLMRCSEGTSLGPLKRAKERDSNKQNASHMCMQCMLQWLCFQYHVCMLEHPNLNGRTAPRSLTGIVRREETLERRQNAMG